MSLDIIKRLFIQAKEMRKYDFNDYNYPKTYAFVYFCLYISLCLIVAIIFHIGDLGDSHSFLYEFFGAFFGIPITIIILDKMS